MVLDVASGLSCSIIIPGLPEIGCIDGFLVFPAPNISLQAHGFTRFYLVFCYSSEVLISLFYAIGLVMSIG